MKIRFICITLSFLLAFGVMITPVKAAMAVYDNQAVAQLIKNVQYLSQQIDLAMQNLEKLESKISQASVTEIKSQLSGLEDMRKDIRGMAGDVKDFQKTWDEVYKDFLDINGLSPEDFEKYAKKAVDATNKSIYDAMRAQGLTAEIGNDAKNLETLLEASQDANGALAAAQVANQLAGMQVVQMMRLQEIIAKSERAQSAYLAQQQQQEAAAKAAAKKLFGVKDDNNDSE